ncbi:RluA family pseudouridine synthase [bacterium]|nr:MAG: RluA family pseudouridine synthase [bacterium]
MTYRNVRIVEPYSFTHQFRVKSADSGLELLPFFAERFPFKSQKQWSEKIEAGHIKVNENQVSDKYRLKTGDLVSHFNPAVSEPSVPDEIQILKETETWLAVYKPAPMPMHSGGRYHKNTLKSILEEELGYEVFITHRLDAVTSGLVLLAKNEQIANRISEAFRMDKVEKEYQALVLGVPTVQKWFVEKGIRRKEGFVFECSDEPNAKAAYTDFEVIQRIHENTLVRCLPKTGRTHQLRLHLAESGYPIVDDEVYLNSNPEIRTQILQNKAIRLCNTKIIIPELDIRIEYPVKEDFWEV